MPLRTFGYAGDHDTGAELQRLWPTMKGPSSVAELSTDAIGSLSWEEASRSLAALMAVPDTHTWSRSRHRRHTGPQPVRDRNWPWGLPWLSPREREAVESQNENLRQIFRAMAKCVETSPSTPVALLHPEDLGPAEHGIPASIWQLPELRLWANRWGLKRYATHQCKFGQSRWPFPLGILSTHPLPHKLFRPGWPRYDEETGRYVGPLSKHCGCPPGAHARDSDFHGRHLRSRPFSLLQPGLLEHLSAVMLGGDATTIAAVELSSMGPEASQVHAAINEEKDEDTADSTDAEQAELDMDELAGLRAAAEPTGRSSWDVLALQALGIQDFGTKEFESTENVTGGGNQQKTDGPALLGDQFGKLSNLTTDDPVGQVKKKRNGTEVNQFLVGESAQK